MQQNRQQFQNNRFFSGCFAFALCLRGTEKRFLYPNDNAYASDKILNRPYLQHRFIRDVWDADAINDEFLDYMYNFDVPDQTPEELFNAAAWATDAEEKNKTFNPRARMPLRKSN